MERRCEAVVVGLGAAGCQAAKTLTEHGLDVAALDAGPLLCPADLPDDVQPLSKRLRPASYWNKLFFGHRTVQARATSFHPRLEHLYVDDRDNPYGTDGGERFLWIRGRQVGGRLHTWARMALRLSDRELAPLWPLRAAELEPWYDEVERFHGISGGLTPLAQRFRERVEARWPERRVLPPRILCDATGPVHANLRFALETGRLRIIPGTPVARVLLERGRACGVEFVDAASGSRRRLEAPLVFLCASAIESVRILLNSGYADRGGLLGRYLLDHNFVVGAGEPGPEYRSVPAAARRSSPLDLSTALDFYLPGARFGMQGTITPGYWAIASFGEMTPDAENRATLAGSVDAHGIRAVNIRIRRGARDRETIDAQKRAIAEVAEAAGLRMRMPLPRPVRGLLWRIVGPEPGVLYPGLSIHECGGARMGDSPDTSVVDPYNRLWEAPNVYVTDGACFPNTGSQNPTLTILALTARAATAAARSAGRSRAAHWR